MSTTKESAFFAVDFLAHDEESESHVGEIDIAVVVLQFIKKGDGILRASTTSWLMFSSNKNVNWRDGS
jgi:hypothetical protein